MVEALTPVTLARLASMPLLMPTAVNVTTAPLTDTLANGMPAAATSRRAVLSDTELRLATAKVLEYSVVFSPCAPTMLPCSGSTSTAMVPLTVSTPTTAIRSTVIPASDTGEEGRASVDERRKKGKK